VALRLGLIGILLVFVLVAASTLRASLSLGPARAVPAPRTRAARLVVVVPGSTGLGAGTEFAVAGEMRVGRDEDNSIVLGDASVSAVHASIVRTSSGWRLSDLGSTNGTTIDGRQIDGRGGMLRGGERVGFGVVQMRFDG
jgi:hypothetical protein